MRGRWDGWGWKNGSNTIKKLSPSDNYSIGEKTVNNRNLISRQGDFIVSTKKSFFSVTEISKKAFSKILKPIFVIITNLIL